VPEVAPICPAEDHVLVVDGGTEPNVVLVEDTLKFRPEQSSTSAETVASPRIEAAALELDYGVWCARALILV
jgi:hypothetical protein